MRRSTGTLLLALCLTTPTAAAAEVVTVCNGGDTFIGGDAILMDMDSSGDAFVAAEAATLGGASFGDLHVTGFDVSVRADVAQDLYAAGATVDIRAVVAGDTSAVGFTLRTAPSSETAGNVRLAGNTVTVEGPVEAALSVLGRTVILNAPIRRDYATGVRPLHN